MSEKTCTSSPPSPRRSCRPQARLHRPADLPGLTLCAVQGCWAAQPRHVHDSLTLGLVTAGARRVETAQGRAVIRAGEAYVLPPGLVHACAPEGGPCSALVFSLEPHILPQGFPAALPLRIRHAGLAGAVLRLAEAVQGPEDNPQRRPLLATALELLAGLSRLAAPVPGAPSGVALEPAVARARELLEAEAEAGLSLAELATRCGAEPFALHRAFARGLGLPPHSYGVHLRLRRAKALLRAGTPPAEAALAAGFCDQSHMNRHFARLVGLTPAQYARARSGRG